MVNEQKLRRAIMFTACFILVRLGVGSGEKCGDVFTKPPSSCCPTKFLPSCCPPPLTKPCNSSATIRPLKPQSGVRVKPFCMKPENSTACEAGFYLNSETKQVEPCPDGFYCGQDRTCIIPCPLGAYCVKDKLVDSTKNSPELCRDSGKCCSPSQSIPLFDTSHSPAKFICPGAKEPVSCPRGSYCEKVTIKKTCPGGHFCRNGTVEPQNCPFLSICKKGSSAPESAVAGIVLILVILGLMLLLMYCFNHEERLTLLFQRHVVQRCHEIKKPKFKIQDKLKRMASFLTMVEKYREGASPKKQTITIRFENLSLVLKKTKKDVLQGVTGQLLPGEVTAVMGPSGSGKTTLLNTLCGKAYYGKRGGRLYINDKEVNDLGVYRNITGFVPQEDVMHRSLTVNEVLIYQANLRLPSTISNEEKRRRIQEVLQLLDLKGVKNTKIGDEESRGISGGQRKRVNIGMELVTDPTLLFLDEPTSGLDSTSSLMVVDALKAVAEERKLTIVCVIHQPRYEIFSKFHKVLFLAPGGKTVFQGTVPGAENYFERFGFDKPDKVNPADFYMDMIGGMFDSKESESTSLPEQWEQYASQNSAGAERVENATGAPDSPVTRQADVTLELSFNPSADILIKENQDQQDRAMPNFLIQFFTFLRREIRLQFRLSRSLLLDQFLVLLAGGTLGALRKEAPLDEFFTLVTLSSLAIGLTAMLSSLRCFGSNRATFWREAASGVNRVSYFVAVNVAQIPIILITPLVYLSLLYPLVSPRGYFRFHYAATLGAQFACTGVGYCISAIFNPKNSQMASVTFALICSLVSGSSPTLCKMDGYSFFGPLLYNLSYCRWYLEALFEKEALRYPDVLALYVHRLSTRNGYTLDNYSTCVGVLFAMGFVYRGLALLFMLFTNRGKQQ